MGSMDSRLYWQLPGPTGFVERICKQAIKARMLVLNLTRQSIPGLREHIEIGLKNSHISRIIYLTIYPGSDISSEIGPHFDTKVMAAHELASQNNEPPVAVVLHPINGHANKKCESYTTEFFNSLKNYDGNTRIVNIWQDEAFRQDTYGKHADVLVFDGGLTEDEMQAYVSMRMINRQGPGSTRLLRSLVVEFAGYDPLFAERLIELSTAEILTLPQQLPVLFGEDQERWRRGTWLSGAVSNASNIQHALHDYYLSQDGVGSEAQEASRRIEQRYWRACLKEIIPWLEERRQAIIQPFLSQLKQIAGSEGKIIIPIGNKGTREIDPVEIEYNNLVWFWYKQQLRSTDSVQLHAINICKVAKSVRDDIAHLRPPDPQNLTDLIHEMDSYIHSNTDLL
ncbi:MAG: hypothetical protein JAY63_10775 [Candidatus Thiodiazotropha taylori]|nr:hypothetical protein [Candidatus Thiodiazotropha taylori]